MIKDKLGQILWADVLPNFSSLKRFIIAGVSSEQNRRRFVDVGVLEFSELDYGDERYHEEALAFLDGAAKAGAKLEYLHL